MTFEIPVVKFEFIITEALFFLETKFSPVKPFASWVGKLQSLRLAIGPIFSIMCKSLYFLISCAFSWSSYIQLDKNSNVEITWWRDNLKYFSTYPIIIDFTTVKNDTTVSSDASGSGYFEVNLDRRIKLKSALFSEIDSLRSSTWRELFAIHQTYTDPAICQKFAGLTISQYTDSKSVANILFKGSKIFLLNVMVKEIFLSVRKNVIKLIPHWVSRERSIIKLADVGSRE